MCGIAACLNVNGKSMVSVVKALQSLQNRGYDSVGICTSNRMCKAVSTDSTAAMTEIQSSDLVNIDTKVSVGHTRWATHGAKTLVNCHPHTADTFMLVHNGIIENYEELRDDSEYYGQTDSEVAVKCYAKHGTKAFEMFHGTFAIVVLDSADPDKLMVAKRGSPLLMGLNANENKLMLVSEISGFDSDIVKYAIIPDGAVDIFEVSDTISYPGYPMLSIDATIIDQSPDPYPHWMLKEIYDQPQAVKLDIVLPEIPKPDHLILAACGTSYHAAQVGANMFRKLGADFSINVIDGADVEAYDFLPNKTNLMIVISQSGETRDLYRALQIAKGKASTLGIVNVEGSLIAREVDVVIYTKAGKENAVASTKSFTSQVTVLWRLASKMLGTDLDLSDLPRAISDAIVSVDIQFESNNCFILGKHALEWIAKEGALKIKEVSYIHAEGYAASALKHGPFALIEPGVPVIVLCNKDEYYPKIINVINEVKSRHATVIAISNVDLPDIVDHHIKLDVNSQLFELVAIISLQMLAYQLAVSKGLNPDYPRNLAKVVTVD